MSVARVSKKKAAELIRSIPPGTIFSVLVKKKTGDREIIRMACQNGVHAGQKGKGRAFDPAKKGLIPIFKMAGSKSGYRFINIPGLKQVIIGGKVYTVR